MSGAGDSEGAGGTPPSRFEAGIAVGAPEGSVSAELPTFGLDEFLADPLVPIDEKRARLETLREELRETSPHASEYEPLERRILDALAMLADGGHSYRPPSI